MNYALLGLTSSVPTPLPAQIQSSYFSFYGQTTHQYHPQYHSNVDSHPGAGNWEALAEEYVVDSSDNMPSTVYDLAATEPWSAVRLAQQGSLLAWEEQQYEDVTGATGRGLERL